MASQSETMARGYETWQTTAPRKGGCRNELGTRAGGPPGIVLLLQREVWCQRMWRKPSTSS